MIDCCVSIQYEYNRPLFSTFLQKEFELTTSLHKALSSLTVYCQESDSISTVTFHRGIEREGLRVNKLNGRISHKPHPKSLGSALTHHSVTTDYSEALLEFITDVHPNVEGVLQELEDIHLYANHAIAQDDECLWPGSIPGYLDGNKDVPIAHYGSSNSGQLKHIYRKGLSYRYGRTMQCIAGMHYNFSFDDSFWEFLQAYRPQSITDNTYDLKSFKSDNYFTLIRNFRRSSWLLPLLFGASPAVDSSFLENDQHNLTPISDDTLLGDKATSLRMSDLGYSNDAQSSLYICCNDIESYIKTLRDALVTPYQEYQKIGVKVGEEYRQLNTNILQIENEFYSDIRPKRVTHPGEHPSAALRDRGVEYIEVRIMDLDPFLNIGMNAETLYFLDVYLLYCMLLDSAELSSEECDSLRQLQQDIVKNGRDLDADFSFLSGKNTVRKQANQLLSDILDVAKILTQITKNDAYVNATLAQIEKLKDVNNLPSEKVAVLTKNQGSYSKAMLHLAHTQQQEWLQQNISANVKSKFLEEASSSIALQNKIENEDTDTFHDFLASYLQPQ